jgi:nucleoside 2-deoxyribosyltransferase
MSEDKCPIWNTPAELLDRGSGLSIYRSPRAGGEYLVSNTAVGRIISLTNLAQRRLTTWLCEQRRGGATQPRIPEDVEGLVSTRRSLSIPFRLNLALQFVRREIRQLGHCVKFDDTDSNVSLRCIAETESINWDDMIELFEMLKSVALVESPDHETEESYRPTVKGWQELEAMTRPATDSSQVFVAMWFDPKMQEAYEKGIAPAIAACGYNPVRIDKKDHNNKIDDEIITEIRRSCFVVADFTCEPKSARGGVYYEAGFARGLEIPVIWTCKDTSLNDLHFDTRQYAHIVWKTPADLFRQLKNRIGATIGDGPLPKIVS